MQQLWLPEIFRENVTPLIASVEARFKVLLESRELKISLWRSDLQYAPSSKSLDHPLLTVSSLKHVEVWKVSKHSEHMCTLRALKAWCIGADTAVCWVASKNREWGKQCPFIACFIWCDSWIHIHLLYEKVICDSKKIALIRSGSYFHPNIYYNNNVQLSNSEDEIGWSCGWSTK